MILNDDPSLQPRGGTNNVTPKISVLSFLDSLRNARFSPEQVAAMRAAYQEILLHLSKPANRRVPPDLSESVARKVLEVSEVAGYDRAAIVELALESIGVQRSDGLKR